MHALITGASAGIGRETALALAAAGLDVLAVARRAEELEALAQAQSRIVPVAADVTTPDGIARIRAAVGGRSIRALVLGAGVFPRGLITGLSAADWRRAMATNVHARLALVLALHDELRGGRVLFVGSDAATTPRPGGAAYSVSKAASAMLWQCLRAELGGEIGFAIARPGLVATAMMHDSLRADRAIFPAGAVYEAMHARGEVIAPETVAAFFRFLLLEVGDDEYAREWDIRDGLHHSRWLAGALFLGTGRRS